MKVVGVRIPPPAPAPRRAPCLPNGRIISNKHWACDIADASDRNECRRAQARISDRRPQAISRPKSTGASAKYQSHPPPGFRPGKVPMGLLKTRLPRQYRRARRKCAGKPGPGELGRGDAAEQFAPGLACRSRSSRPSRAPTSNTRCRSKCCLACPGSNSAISASKSWSPTSSRRRMSTRPLDRMAEQYRNPGRRAHPQERPRPRSTLSARSTMSNSWRRGTSQHLARTRRRSVHPGFEDQIYVGAKGGDSRLIKVTFPADYGVPDLAGKDAVFEVRSTTCRSALPRSSTSLATRSVSKNLGEARRGDQGADAPRL